MRKMKLRMTAAAAALMAGMLLGGCGETAYELTESEENVIVNYAAHVVTKYNTYQKEGLTYAEPESEEETDKEEAVTSDVQDQAPAQQGASEPDAAGTENTENRVTVPASSSATLSELFGGSGTEITYVGTRVDSSYMAGDYYAMYPDEGKVYVLVGIDITNTSDTPVDIDVLSRTPQFTAVVNGSVKSTAELTVLKDDFGTFQETVTAGSTRETVLVFQVPDTVTSVDSLELYVQLDDNIQIIL